jgi:hypothetical protein
MSTMRMFPILCPTFRYQASPSSTVTCDPSSDTLTSLVPTTATLAERSSEKMIPISRSWSNRGAPSEPAPSDLKGFRRWKVGY